MRVLVTGGRGFIASHLVDALVERGDQVWVIDSNSSTEHDNEGARYHKMNLVAPPNVHFEDVDLIFHCAAIGRTPWAVAEPILCWNTNLMASVRLLEMARQSGVKRVILSSSNIVYAAPTPYRASKLAMEEAAKVYSELYGLSTVCLRYANCYGPRQREDGIGPNVFPSMRKSLREKGYIEITGDGVQSRDFIHVSDVVRANLLAAESDAQGNYDICTGRNHSLAYVVGDLLDAPIKNVAEREGDIKHIVQDPLPALEDLGFTAETKLEDGIWDSFPNLRTPALAR